nr:YihY/virulence factor BrkB family protein [Sedimentibacter sp.]
MKILKLLKKLGEDDIFSLSAQFSYYIILGIFPFIILLISIFGYYTSILYYLLDASKLIIPQDAYNIISNIVKQSDGYYNKSYMSVSILALVWSSSSGSVSIIKGINKAYDYPIRRNYFFIRIKGILFTSALMFSLQIVFFFIVAGNHLIFWLQQISVLSDIMVYIINILRYVLPLALLVIIFSFTYKFLRYEKVRFRTVLPGAVFATFGCIIGSVLFSNYINRKSIFYDNIYGSLSGVFILLIWIYMSCLIFLLGAEINALRDNRGA